MEFYTSLDILKDEQMLFLFLARITHLIMRNKLNFKEMLIMNFIQWLKMDYARSKNGWFLFHELREKTPTDRGFKIFYATVIPILIWAAPVTYLIEKKLTNKLTEEFKIKEEA